MAVEARCWFTVGWRWSFGSPASAAGSLLHLTATNTISACTPCPRVPALIEGATSRTRSCNQSGPRWFVAGGRLGYTSAGTRCGTKL
jgi:hypothetical protein